MIAIKYQDPPDIASRALGMNRKTLSYDSLRLDQHRPHLSVVSGYCAGRPRPPIASERSRKLELNSELDADLQREANPSITQQA